MNNEFPIAVFMHLTPIATYNVIYEDKIVAFNPKLAVVQADAITLFWQWQFTLKHCMKIAERTGLLKHLGKKKRQKYTHKHECHEWEVLSHFLSKNH